MQDKTSLNPRYTIGAAKLPTISSNFTRASTLELQGLDGKSRIRVHSNGKVELINCSDADEAARIFWSAVERMGLKLTTPEDAPTAVAVPDERAAFEAWVTTVDDHPLTRLGDGYNWHSIQAKWELWKGARAALAAAPAAPTGWRELCRRLYVELLHCDKQMMQTLNEEGEPMWEQGATVRDVLRDASEALAVAPAAPASAPIAPDVAAELERTDWTAEEALRWYAAGRHYDTVPNGDGTSSARILDNGAVASNALKSLSTEYAAHKGDVALLEAAPAPVVLPEPVAWQCVSNGIPVHIAAFKKPKSKDGEYLPLYTEQQVRALLATATGLPAQAVEPLCWVNEDELPESMSEEAYSALFPHSKVDVVRMFPIFAAPQAQADAREAAITWPKARDVGRIGDMSAAAHIRAGLDSDNDVYVSVWDENGGGSIEFCNPGGGGGGQSSRTRVALIALMAAMEADNAEKPSRDWWAQRAAQAAKGA